MKYRSIVYLNFAPYENAGRILDFLVDSFELVILFSFSFHKLSKKGQSNYIHVYRSGKRIEDIKLFKLPTPEALLFLTLPLIVGLIALQTFWYLVKFHRKYGQLDLYFSVNAFTAWIGNLLRAFKIVDKTVFWVWDYYPPGYPDWKVRLARWGYWRFDRWATTASDQVVGLNKRLIQLRKEIGAVRRDVKYPIVPIGTNPGQLVKATRPIIGHLGVLKQSQGLDLLFDVLPDLLKKMPELSIEIVGSGPDEAHFKERAKDFSQVKFYGFVKEEDRVDEIIRQWTAGVATYTPDKSNPSSWTDPSKIKLYISQGVPVITTASTPFSAEIGDTEAGIVINYNKPEEFVAAAIQLSKQADHYKSKAYELAKTYYYKELYPKLFDF